MSVAIYQSQQSKQKTSFNYFPVNFLFKLAISYMKKD